MAVSGGARGLPWLLVHGHGGVHAGVGVDAPHDVLDLGEALLYEELHGKGGGGAREGKGAWGGVSRADYVGRVGVKGRVDGMIDGAGRCSVGQRASFRNERVRV